MRQVLLTGMPVGHTASLACDLPNRLPVCTAPGRITSSICVPVEYLATDSYKCITVKCYLIKPLLLTVPYNSVTEKINTQENITPFKNGQRTWIDDLQKRYTNGQQVDGIVKLLDVVGEGGGGGWCLLKVVWSYGCVKLRLYEVTCLQGEYVLGFGCTGQSLQRTRWVGCTFHVVNR